MRTLLRFLYRYHFFLVFLTLEIIAVTIGFRYNKFQQAAFVKFTENISGYFNEKISAFTDYFSLVETNRKLAFENAALKNQLQRVYRSDELFFFSEEDTLYRQKYFFTSARVVNNSIHNMYNFLTLDKGREQGMRPEMGVISTEGVVGITVGVSQNFTSVMSLLNKNFHLSARLKKNNYFGSLSWDGVDYLHAQLTEIPHHVDIHPGDTVITSGYSAIFPEGIPIGVVEKAELRDASFYTASIRLFTDFKHLVYVDVIGNLKKEEQRNLENRFHD
ncbi:MAG: rod shape-determining protein MreC [Chlorobi bacterium]|nr:rod shape-determining protein MreC [Chlorobiota bacterium]